MAENINCDENSNLTLEDLNSYITSLKEWITHARAAEFIQQQFIQRTMLSTTHLQDNMYHRLGYSLQVLPPLWKRVAAEAIDVAILFVMKLYLTFVIFYNLELPLPDKDNFISFFDSPKKAMEMSSELALLEMLYRVLVCFYETYWLHGAEPATPGKLCLGLRVIYIQDIIETNVENHVRVIPAEPLGWRKAFYRAVLKNILLGIVMFPMTCGLFLFKYNRTGYDLMVGSLVIEHRPLGLIQEDHEN